MSKSNKKYNEKFPVIHYRVDADLRKIINEYKKKMKYDTDQAFMDSEFVNGFKKKHVKIKSYELRD